MKCQPTFEITNRFLDSFFQFSQQKRNCSPNLCRGETRPASRSLTIYDISDKVWRLFKNRYFSNLVIFQMSADISKNRYFNFAFSIRICSKISYLSIHRSETSFVSTLSVQILQKLLIFVHKLIFLGFWNITFFEVKKMSAGLRPADI